MSEETGAETRNVRKQSFEMIPRAVLQDARISYRAVGVLVDLLSRPPGWKASAARLSAARQKPRSDDGAKVKGCEGREAVETALRELEMVGYLARKRVQNRATGTWGWVWIYGDDPQVVAASLVEELAAFAARAAA